MLSLPLLALVVLGSDRLPGEPPRTNESTFQGGDPGDSRLGLQPHLLAALGMDAAQGGAPDLRFGLSLCALAGVAYNFTPRFGAEVQLGAQVAVGGPGGYAGTSGLGIAYTFSDVRLRLTVGPALVFSGAPTALGLSVSADMLRRLKGPLTIGFSAGYLRFDILAGSVTQQQLRLGISIGYGL